MLLKDRIVCITGASRGIGAATAKRMALHGASVGVNYLRSREAAESVVRSIREEGGRALAVQADVRDREQVRAMFDVLGREYGPVDTLVVNAAIQFPIRPFLEIRWEDFEAKLLGEIGSAFHCCREAVPSMIERGRGCIVLVSSGLSRQPGPGFVTHSTAKSGLDAFGKSLALELGPMGIRVNVVAPGLTITDATAGLPESQKEHMARLTPMGRNALPEDVAGAILMMASEDAGFVTGSYLPVSGGIQMP